MKTITLPAHSSASSLSLPERWLTGHQRLVLAAIVVVSVLLRITYFVEIYQGPCFWEHRWSQSDMNFFDIWAQDIAHGDRLTDKVLHPHHRWYQWIANEYFRLHPQAVPVLSRGGRSSLGIAERDEALWDRWLGGKTFQQEPLYPYLIALTYKVFGAEVQWVFAWQMLLGVASNVLVYLIARRHFGVMVAAVAGLLAVFCSPMLFYNNVLLRATLIIFMGLVLVQLTDLALERGTWRWWLLSGLACGLAVLLKVTFIPFWLGVLVILAYRYQGNPRVLLRSMVALVGGMILCLLPVIGRNLAVGAPPLSLESVGPITFICYNAEDYPPEIGFNIDLKYAPRIMGRTGGAFVAAAVETLKTHPTPWSYLNLLWRKFALIWQWYEIPNNTNFYYYRLHSKVLRYLPVTFLLLAPLSIMGLALAIGLGIPCWPLYLSVISNVAVLLLSGALSRFRVPLMALLLPFAGLTLVQIAQWVWNRQTAIGLAAIEGLLLLSLWTMRPLPEHQPLIRAYDFTIPYSFYYNRLEQQAIHKDDWPRAAEILKDFLLYEPAAVKEMCHSRPPWTEEEAMLAKWFANVHRRYAQALQKTGRAEAAREEEKCALKLLQASQGHRLDAQ